MVPTPKRCRGRTESHVRATAQERETAKRAQGRLTPGSGSKRLKGDVQVPKLARLECKTTAASSFRVTIEMVEKLSRTLVGTGEIPIICVELLLGKHKLIVMPDSALEDLLEKLRLAAT